MFANNTWILKVCFTVWALVLVNGVLGYFGVMDEYCGVRALGKLGNFGFVYCIAVMIAVYVVTIAGIVVVAGTLYNKKPLTLMEKIFCIGLGALVFESFFPII